MIVVYRIMIWLLNSDLFFTCNIIYQTCVKLTNDNSGNLDFTFLCYIKIHNKENLINLLKPK